MKRMLWLLLALVEIVVAFILARPAVYNALKICFTRKEVFEPNAAYFMGMLAGDFIRIIPALILVTHMVWIARMRILQTSTVG
jgi:hypothetical protein